MITINHKAPRELTMAEIEALLYSARLSGRQDLLLVALPLDSGLRLREIADLRAAAFQGGGLLVDGKRGRRWVPLSYGVARGLESLAQGEDVIWRSPSGDPMSAGALGSAYRRLFDQAGIQGACLGAYTLRRTFAARFIGKGGDPTHLARIMGYRDAPSAIKMGFAGSRDIADAHAEFSPLSELDFDPDWV